MGLLERLQKERNQQIMSKARPHLAEDEEIVDWVRAKDPDDGRKGILFITRQRALVVWSGRDGHGEVQWASVKTWGINQDRRDGPVLCIEDQQEATYIVQLPVNTEDMARTAGRFIRAFADLAPWPESGTVTKGATNYKPEAETEFRRTKRTPAEMLKRWGLIFVGAALIVIGILIIPLPGPWSFVLNIAGLAVLAREFDLADDALEWTKDRFEAAKKKMSRRKRKRSASDSGA